MPLLLINKMSSAIKSLDAMSFFDSKIRQFSFKAVAGFELYRHQYEDGQKNEFQIGRAMQRMTVIRREWMLRTYTRCEIPVVYD